MQEAKHVPSDASNQIRKVGEGNMPGEIWRSWGGGVVVIPRLHEEPGPVLSSPAVAPNYGLILSLNVECCGSVSCEGLGLHTESRRYAAGRMETSLK